MAASVSLVDFFWHAGLVVKCVMLLLLGLSIASWAVIFQRAVLFKEAKEAALAFEDRFWSGTELKQLFQGMQGRPGVLSGMEHIFYAGFQEFSRLREQGVMAKEDIMEGVQRAMRIAQSREVESLEAHLSFLATVGSISPYIGLFGTVWGIMTSFQALSGMQQQVTISVVAPGISEALVATAIGLFAAIPAVIAYNRYASDFSRLAQQYATFQEELASVLHRELHKQELM